MITSDTVEHRRLSGARQLGARVPEPLRRRLQAAARELGEPEAVLVRQLLRRGLEQLENGATVVENR